MLILQVTAILALVALTASAVWAAWVFSHRTETLEPVEDPEKPVPGLEEIIRKLALHDQEFAALKLAVSDGILRVDRADKRIQKSVTGARRLLRENGLEHPALEAEFEELGGEDGTGSEEPELQLMPSDVEPNQKTGIPGVSWAQLQEINARVRHD